MGREPPPTRIAAAPSSAPLMKNGTREIIGAGGHERIR